MRKIKPKLSQTKYNIILGLFSKSLIVIKFRNTPYLNKSFY